MDQRFAEHYEVPECVYPYVDLMVSEQEQKMTAGMGTASFTARELSERMGCSLEEAGTLLANAYKRSVVNKDPSKEDGWTIGNFYERLGVFCQYESEVWYGIPRSERDKINRWYLEAFISLNKPKWETGRRKDCVAPLNEAIEAVERKEGPFFVRTCDCRIIFDNCGKPRETCISLSDGPNTPADRGQARKLTKEETIELLKQCEKDGLMHTLEDEYGICNCCGDCCFVYLAAKKCGMPGILPASHTIARHAEEKCTNCGICTKRCHLNAFTRENGKVSFHSGRCAGCGICLSTCPQKAISLAER